MPTHSLQAPHLPILSPTRSNVAYESYQSYIINTNFLSRSFPRQRWLFAVCEYIRWSATMCFPSRVIKWVLCRCRLYSSVDVIAYFLQIAQLPQKNASKTISSAQWRRERGREGGGQGLLPTAALYRSGISWATLICLYFGICSIYNIIHHHVW